MTDVRRTPWSRPALPAVLLVALMAATTGCSDSPDSAPASSRTGATSSASATSSVPVLQPGEPGEPATTLSPGSVISEDQATEADIAFMQMMIPHHEQAVVMTRLAADRASSPRVRALAERIAGQGGEILMMSAWLQRHGLPVPSPGESHQEMEGMEGMDHGMPGMLTEDQMAALRSARGADFDRLFLTRMIGHHEGALSMVADVQRDGADVQVAELAADIQATQTAEIATMRRLLGA